MKKLIIAGLLISATACASHEPGISVVDQVAQRKASIASAQSAGAQAKQVCGDLGLQGNHDCESDLARAALNIGPNEPLPKFTKISE